MNRVRYPVRKLILVLPLLLTLLLGRGGTAVSQVPTPTPEQLQMFQSLSPDQQDAILNKLGIGGNSGTSGQGTGNDRQGNDRSDRGFDQQRQQRDRETDEEAEPKIPVLKGEDSVIIEVDYQLPARSPALAVQSLLNTTAPDTSSGSAPAAGGAAAAPALPAGVSPSAIAGIVAAQQANAAAAPPANAATNQLPDDEKKRLDNLIALIRLHNPYTLSKDGVLVLPGFPPVPLAGLTDEQATLRLRVEPALHGIDIRLTRLPLKKIGFEGLKPFGYDLFDRSPSTFAPVTNVPVPGDYVLGPGDEMSLQLYGAQNKTVKITVGRDGHINLPEIGPVNVGGQRFYSVKSSVEGRIERQMLGVHASLSMGDTRSIRVFVLGEARRPGSYTISGLGTITSALYAAGGVKRIGSLRRLQLKRQGVLVKQFDLYDLLVRGNTSDDVKLLQGDVILIPPIGPTVSVDGEVRRPAIYELRNEATAAELVRLAGGLTVEADPTRAVLTRIDEKQRRTVLPVDLSAGAATLGLRNGDLFRVSRLRPTLDSGVTVQGHVFAEGAYAYHPGLRLSQVIPSVDDLRPNADEHYVLVRREMPPDRHIAVLSVDLAAALREPGTSADPELMPRDRITVFDLESGRDRIIQPLLSDLRLQSSSEQPASVVHVEGHVKVPGEYPLETGMTVRDLIRAGGGTTEAAYGGKAELVRFSVINGESRRTELININLSAALRGDPAANLRLQAFDTLSVKEVSEWEVQENVTLRGEVRFPGDYAIRRGETLKSVLARAGGLTQYAFPEGSVFTRDELRQREQEQLDMLAQRMQRDLALLALQAAGANQSGAATAMSVGQSLLGQLKSQQAVGRLVINLPKLDASPEGSQYDVILHGGDTLSVPRFQQQVTVIGEVQTVTSHLYTPKLSRDGYIALSGGLTNHADHSKIYIVRADGSVVASQGGRWFNSQATTPIKPGDTIVVPLDTEHIPALPLWTQVTQILYNIAIAVLAVNSIH